MPEYSSYAESTRRAEDLLIRHLTPSQKSSWRSKGRFIVRSQHGNLYRINRGSIYNIERLNNRWRVLAKYCIQPVIQGIPLPDSALGQKILLELNEDLFLQIANKQIYAHPVRATRTTQVRFREQSQRLNDARLAALEAQSTIDLVPNPSAVYWNFDYDGHYD